MLLAEKKVFNRKAADKLKGGLNKLVETREQVAKMQVVCQEKQLVVAQAKKECEEVLVQIVTEKRIVDDQEMKATSLIPSFHFFIHPLLSLPLHPMLPFVYHCPSFRCFQTSRSHSSRFVSLPCNSFLLWFLEFS